MTRIDQMWPTNNSIRRIFLLLSVSGKLEIGTKLAEFCSHALLALDVLTHPRALSLEGAAPLGPGLNYGAPEAAVFGAGSSLGVLPQAPDDWLEFRGSVEWRCRRYKYSSYGPES
jgi:hypothetical protein